MKTYQKTLSAAAALALFPAQAMASGFQVNTQSARSTARCLAVNATADDAASIFYNPAGMTNVEGTEFEVGMTLIFPKSTYQGPGLDSTNPGGGEVVQATTGAPAAVPNLYVARALSKKAYVGLGVFVPYGLGSEYDDPDWVGRTVAVESRLQTFYITPSIALELSDMVSVGVGVSLVPAALYIKRTLGASDNNEILFPSPQFSREGFFEISGTAFGVGATAGAQITLIDHLKIGLSYRSSVELSFSGDVNFEVPEELPAEIAANFPDGTGSGDLRLPHSFSAGLGWDAENWTIEANFQLTLWQSFDELRINFDSGMPSPSSAAPRDWTAVPLIALGGEYRLGRVALRAGAALDFSPVPIETIEPALPDNDRILFSAGVGYDFGSVYLDAAYMGVFVNSTDVPAGVNVNFAPNVESRYQGRVNNVFATSLGVRI